MDKRDILAGIIVGVIILSLLAVMVTVSIVHFDNKNKEFDILEQIKSTSLEELGFDKNSDATIVFTGYWEEYDPCDWKVYLYTLKVEGIVYVVGAHRKGWIVSTVYVIGEVKK